MASAQASGSFLSSPGLTEVRGMMAFRTPMQRELVLPIISWAAKFESQLRSERLKALYRAKRAHASPGG